MAEQGRLLAAAGSEEAGAERLRRALQEFEALGNRRWQVRTLADLADVIAAVDPEETDRLRSRAAEIARRHDLQSVLRRPKPARERPLPTIPAVHAEALGEVASAWQEAASRRSDRLVDFIDPLFRILVEAYGVRRATLTLPGGVAAVGATAAPEGPHARLEKADDNAGRPARFVLIPGGEPTGQEAGRTEVAMGARSSALRLSLARDEEFAEAEIASIEALGRLASFALEGPLERLGRKEVTRVEAVESLEGLIGSAPAMREVYRLIEQVAPTDSSVLLLGESGTGKELAARAIHARSARGGGPFVAISCPSIPRELIEAELFGHEKGAFTGANTMRPGKVELADGGTLFLDEVGDMAVDTQVRLLRFLEEREFQRVGGRETRTVNVRILAATSRDLTEAVEGGEFRQDLFYRLNVVPIRLPSLRKRREDIPMLVYHFLGRQAGAGRTERPVSGQALEMLTRHDWPGNVRELRNAVEYMATLGRDAVLDETHVPEAIRAAATGAAKGGSPEAAGTVPARTHRLRRGETMEARLQEVEAALIRSTLEGEDWNQSAAARRLGITESKIRNRMKQYGIRRPDRNTGESS
jgi:two-component system nitrogen regulation response regulator GlnG